MPHLLDWLVKRWHRAPGPMGGRTVTEVDSAFDTQSADERWAATAPQSMPALLDEPAAQRESELRRLAALQARGLTALQYVAETAARICETPMAAVTLVDGDSVWLQAAVGLEMERLPQAHSFCPRVLEGSPAAMVVHDALTDARFCALPTVTGEPKVRFYAGAPFASDRGVALGVVCVMDTLPRELTPVQVRTLELLARQTAMLLEARANAGRIAEPPAA